MTADDLVRWYYRQRDSFSAPPMNFVDSTGRVYAASCPSCNHKIRHGKSNGDWVCGSCGRPWEFVDRHIFKGEVQKTARIDTFEHRYAKWIDLGTQLHHFMNDDQFRTTARVYVAFVMGFKVAQISATHSPKLWFTEPGAAWSERTVYRHKEAGRTEWVRRLMTTGIPFDQ